MSLCVLGHFENKLLVKDLIVFKLFGVRGEVGELSDRAVADIVVRQECVEFVVCPCPFHSAQVGGVPTAWIHNLPGQIFKVNVEWKVSLCASLREAALLMTLMLGEVEIIPVLDGS